MRNVIKALGTVVCDSTEVVSESVGYVSDFVSGHRKAYQKNESIRVAEHVINGLDRIAEVNKSLEKGNYSEEIKNRVSEGLTNKFLEAWEL